MEKLFIISNESIYSYEESFFCDNIELKTTPEGLNNKFEVNIISRESKKVRSHKINLKNIKIYSNIASYIFAIFISYVIFLQRILALILLIFFHYRDFTVIC